MIDFVRLCRTHHVPHLSEGGHHHARNGWVQVHCPKCAGGQRGWHLGYSLNRGIFSCYRCGALRFWDVLPKLLRVSEEDARRLVGGFKAAAVLQAREAPVVRQRNIKPPPGAGPLLQVHRDYLTGRGFDPSILEQEWGLLGTARSVHKWSWRVIIPIINGDDRVVAYQGRSVGTADHLLRYKVTDDADCLDDPRTFIYGINRVPEDTVIIVEGCPVVWRMGPGAVATLGIDWKGPQANRLRQFSRRFICFDSERKAQDRARQLAEHMAQYGGETEIVDVGRELDDLSPSDVSSIRREFGL